jgi:hypothetical protein
MCQVFLQGVKKIDQFDEPFIMCGEVRFKFFHPIQSPELCNMDRLKIRTVWNNKDRGDEP